ncbi:methyl-accepting chemotaxis protein [Pseudoduganella chitinolytica]|uniref:Methyl-accepting chemotaxis protein n=1 Tax=Pseudoduganella chitinolytica TaxID=34070 RepID=A0ABY8BGS4_9BURK|nr:methyl-accepting chemotaxis protein [Pseudoduganella chitinolytica]WEF33489.1 methyl-accepting chemotaxis protein [Pseudoduganella chitinolytica]
MTQGNKWINIHKIAEFDYFWRVPSLNNGKMMKLSNLPIRTLLRATLGTLIVIIALSGGGSFWLVNYVIAALESSSTADLTAQATVDKIRLRMEANRSQVLQALQHNPGTRYAAMHDHPLSIHDGIIAKNSADIVTLWDAYRKGVEDPAERDLADRWYRDSGRLGLDSTGAAARAITGDNWDDAQKILISTINPVYREADKQAVGLAAYLQERAVVRRAAVEASIDTAITVGTAAIALAVAIAWAAGRYITRTIGTSLEQAVNAAQRVAAGDLTTDISASSRNEFGVLLRALGQMTVNLRDVVGAVSSGAQGIASASGQIAGGNRDLSQRTEKQAAALEETASAMEELTNAVKQNGQHAREASTLATRATGVAEEGGAVVDSVIQTMASIDASARRITDITSVIDGIAFQTNILALNAAVEAARAGEQGRGFAVVAAEVRALAHRSATAAKEIKELIGASLDQVDAGGALVAQAGRTMSQIVQNVREVSRIIGAIETASTEQEAGIVQVHRTLADIDSSTQQNAALVEEAFAASAALHEQAEELSRRAATFQLASSANPVLAVKPASAADRSLPVHAAAPGRLALSA